MGNKEDWVPADNSFPSQEDLISNLVYIEQGQIANDMLAVGKFSIYRFKKAPYQLIMKHVRTLCPDSPKQQEYSKMSKVIASRIHHKNIAKIHSINICSSICTKEVSIESYVNYYAINLQQIIEKRKMNDVRFTSQEIWYILNSLIEVSSYLKKKQIYFGVYLARNIYLSHEGYLKIYLYHLNSNNNHILYYHMINSSNRDMHKYLPLPPQCLPFLKEKTKQLKYISLQKLDVFGIGMIALQAMLFHSTRKYYSTMSKQDSFHFDQNLLRKDFQELRDIYSIKLINLLEKMVKIHPHQRLSFQEVRTYLNQIKVNTSINGSIKMIEDQQNPIEPKISYSQVVEKKQYNKILRSITHNQISGESKLRFIPLRQISRQKQKNQAEHHNASQIRMSVHTVKKKKLSLSQQKRKIQNPKQGYLDLSITNIFRC